MPHLRAVLSPNSSRRFYAAAASILVNAFLAFLATRQLTGSVALDSEQAAPDHSVPLTINLVVSRSKPPETNHRRPSMSQPARVARTRPFVLDTRGPPTETVKSLQARLSDRELARGTNERTQFPCDDAAAAANLAVPVKVSLLILVGADGRVIESELRRSSGTVRVDEAVKQCARSWGPFPLAIIDGRILESWRLVEWAPEPHASSME